MKRLSLLIRAFALIYKNHPEWQLKIVGDGPYWDFYHEMARQLGITDRVEFTGSVSASDLGSHMEKADIFCHPSLIDSFPLILGDAAAHALPMAGYRYSIASASMITPDMGVLADENTPESLADALLTLINASPEKREEMGLKARESFQTKYNGKILFDKWEQLINTTFESVKKNGETALGRIWRKRMSKSETENHIGQEWDGLGPDSPVWTVELLEDAAAEIAGRKDPRVSEPGDNENVTAENIRLRCELAQLKQEHRALEQKYSSLMEQYKQTAVRKQKRR